MSHSLALVILALNEEASLRSTYESHKRIFSKLSIDHEIFIINDGSIDQTGEIAEKIRAQDPCVKVFHNTCSKGMGFGYKQGLKSSTKDYFMYTGAYNPLKEESLVKLLGCMGESDMVIDFIANAELRHDKRAIYSRRFTNLMRWITGLNLKYFNGLAICRTECLKSIKIRSNRYTFNAEGIVKLIKLKNCGYREVGIHVNKRERESFRLFKLVNLLDVLRFLIFLWYDGCLFKGSSSDHK